MHKRKRKFYLNDVFRYDGYKIHIGTDNQLQQSRLITIMEKNGYTWLGTY